MKKLSLLLFFLVFLVALPLSYGIVINENAKFTPSLSNVTYNFSESVKATFINVNSTCLTIEYEELTETYCNTSPTDIVIDLDFLTVKANNSWNNSKIDILNVTLSDGTTTKQYNSSYGQVVIPYTELGGWSDVVNVTVGSNDNGGYFDRSFLNINKTNSFQTKLWQSTLDIYVRDAVTNALIDGVNISLTHNGINNLTLGSDGTESYRLNTNTYFVNASHFNYVNETYTNNLTNLEEASYTFYLNPIYNLTFRREETGEAFNFVEDLDTYQCVNSTYNATVYYLQTNPNYVNCTGNSTFSDVHDCESAYDGSTYTYAAANTGTQSSINFTFTKPINVTNQSKLAVWYDILGEVNYTIPTLCWANDDIKIRNEMNYNDQTIEVSCWRSGGGWTKIANETNGGYLYEEGIYWGYNQTTQNYSTCLNTTEMYFDLKIVCDDTVVSQTINSSAQDLTVVNCSYNYLLITAIYSTETYYRTLIPNSTDYIKDIYMLDLNEDEAIEIIISVNDLASNYDNGIIKVKTYINGTKYTVIEQHLDIEAKATLWLDRNQVYEICAVDDDSVEECYGDIIADTAGTKTLTLPAIPLFWSGEYFMENVRWNYSANKNDSTAMLTYYDTSDDGYYSLEWTIWEYGTNTSVFSNTTTNGYNLSLTATGLDEHTDYLSVLIINHSGSPELIKEIRILWTASATTFPGWDDDTLPIKFIAAMLIPALLLLIFSRKSAEVGMTATLISVVVFRGLDWYKYAYTRGYNHLWFDVFIAIFAVLTFIMWTRKSEETE